MPGLCLVVEYRKNKIPACPQGVLNLLNLPEIIEPAVEPGFLSSKEQPFLCERKIYCTQRNYPSKTNDSKW